MNTRCNPMFRFKFKLILTNFFLHGAYLLSKEFIALQCLKQTFGHPTILELQTMSKDHRCRSVQFSRGSGASVNFPILVGPGQSPGGKVTEHHDISF